MPTLTNATDVPGQYDNGQAALLRTVKLLIETEWIDIKFDWYPKKRSSQDCIETVFCPNCESRGIRMSVHITSVLRNGRQVLRNSPLYNKVVEKMTLGYGIKCMDGCSPPEIFKAHSRSFSF